MQLQFTRFGRHLFAVGSNERTARLCGVRVDRAKVTVYTVAAMLAGLAGVMEFSRLSVGDPTVAVGLELDVIAAVIIGGTSLAGGAGTIWGTLVGIVFIGVVANGMTLLDIPVPNVSVMSSYFTPARCLRLILSRPTFSVTTSAVAGPEPDRAALGLDPPARQCQPRHRDRTRSPPTHPGSAIPDRARCAAGGSEQSRAALPTAHASCWW